MMDVVALIVQTKVQSMPWQQYHQVDKNTMKDFVAVIGQCTPWLPYNQMDMNTTGFRGPDREKYALAPVQQVDENTTDFMALTVNNSLQSRQNKGFHGKESMTSVPSRGPK